MNQQEKDYLISALETQKEFGAEVTFGANTSSLADLASKKKVQSIPQPQKVNSEPEVTVANDMTPKPSIEQPQNTVTVSKTNNPAPMNDWAIKAKEIADRVKTLDELREEVEKFDGLSIKKTANKCVFAEGHPEADIMLIGEAPGANEDTEGRPFCGVSGQLLDKILNFAGYSRDKNCYITNTIFWRPPGNRKPSPEELAICKPFLEKHIALLKPKVIILVGGTATFSVLNNKSAVSLLRETVHQYSNSYLNSEIPCFAVYHPSYLLRQPSQKKNMWFDILKIKNFIERI